MLLMKAVQLEKQMIKRKRLTIPQTFEQSCEDSPNVESKPVNNRLDYCATKSTVGQKSKKFDDGLADTGQEEAGWTFEEDISLVRNYPFYTTKELAGIMDKPFDEIGKRFAYLSDKAKATTGSESDDL